MESQLKDLSSKMDSLEKLFNLYQQNINFNIALTWSVFLGVIAITGGALYILAKMWVDKRVKIELEPMRQKVIDSIKETPEFITIQGQTHISEQLVSGTDINLGVLFNLDEKYEIYFPPQIDLYYKSKNDELIKLSQYKVLTSQNEKRFVLKKNDLMIRFKRQEDMKDPVDDFKTEIHYNIVWKNKKY